MVLFYDYSNIYIYIFFFRKHTLNCHRMKPSLFSVLCEIKEKTGKYFKFYVGDLKIEWVLNE